MHPYYWDGGYHMMWMGLAWIMAVAVLAAAAVFAVWLFRPRHAVAGGPPMEPPRESPEDILKRRYARGEIDRETYDRMLDDLKK